MRSGGADVFLYYRHRTTKEIEATLDFESDAGSNRYHARFTQVAPDSLSFNEERIEFLRTGSDRPQVVLLDSPSKESQLLQVSWQAEPSAAIMRKLLYGCQAFQFHDTSAEAYVRKTGGIDKRDFLYRDAGNLAAFLYMLKTDKPDHYMKIVATIRQAAPFFEDFNLEPTPNHDTPKYIMLNWWEAGKEYSFGPHELPDGLLRYMALVTLLRQPKEYLPSVIIIDEPELGLHPAAVTILGGLIRSVSHFCQVIIATQAPLLVDQFRPEDTVVLEREKVEGKNEYCSTVKRLSREQLKGWIEDYTYSLSDLWQKNLFGGTP